MAGRTLKSARGIIPVHPSCRCTWKPYIEGVMRKPTLFPRGIPFETAGVSLAGYRRKPKKPKKRRGGRIAVPRKGIRAKAVRKVPRARSGLDMMDSSTRATFTNTMSELEARWGFKPDRIVSKDLGADVPTEVVDVRGKKVMRLNPRYWKGVNSRKLESELKQMTKDGWLAQPDLASHITHEYGHVVELGMSDKEHQRMRNAVGDIGGKRLGKLSRYAMPPSYPQEAFCEALASDRNNGYVPKELKALITPPKAAVIKTKKVMRRVGGKTVFAKKKALSFKGVVREGVARGDDPATIRKSLRDLYHSKGITDEAFIEKSFKMKVREVGRERKKVGVPTKPKPTPKPTPVPVKPKPKVVIAPPALIPKPKPVPVIVKGESRTATQREWREFSRKQDASEWSQKRSQLIKPGVTSDQWEAASEYAAEGYAPTNRALRGGRTPAAKRQKSIDDLTALIDKSPLQQDLIAYRGMVSKDIVKNWDNMLGTIMEDKAFVSTSLSKNVAKGFLPKFVLSPKYKHRVMCKIRVPKGTKALAMQSFSGSPEEVELLMQRGVQMRVVKTSIRGGVHQLTLEVLEKAA